MSVGLPISPIALCERCAKGKISSTVSAQGPLEKTESKPITYTDAAGVLHTHDMNRYSIKEACSAGHVYVRTFYEACPLCKWFLQDPYYRYEVDGNGKLLGAPTVDEEKAAALAKLTPRERSLLGLDRRRGPPPKSFARTSQKSK